MRNLGKLRALLGIVAIVVWAAPIGAQCTTSAAIVAPIDILKPGCYTLASTVMTGTMGPTALGIRIMVSDVHLDLSGYGVNSMTLTQPAIVAAAGLNNITIRNGVINGGAEGVRILSGTNITIEKLQIFSPANHAILLGDGTSIVVRDNRVWGGSGFAIGLGVQPLSSATIEGNTLENVDQGITIKTAQSVVVRDNRVSGVDFTHGIDIDDAHGFDVIGNSVTLVANGSGIAVANSSSGFTAGNVINQAGSHGISLNSTLNTLLQNNVAGGNTLTGIHIHGSFNFVERNVLNQNGQSGLWIEGTATGSTGNTYGRNSVTSSATTPATCAGACDPNHICDEGPDNISFGDNAGPGPC